MELRGHIQRKSSEVKLEMEKEELTKNSVPLSKKELDTHRNMI